MVTDNSSSKRRRVVVIDIPSDEEQEYTTSSSSPVAGRLQSDCLPSDGAMFSDENLPTSSPPSSPPPMFPATITKPVDEGEQSGCRRETTVNAFSMLRRQPLHKIVQVAQKEKKKPLVQMQLNLGQPFQKKCRGCGMEYVPSSPEDSALHLKFHKQNVDGIFISRDFLKKAESWRGIEKSGKDRAGWIVSISQHWRCRTGRQYIMPILKVVQAELGAVDIPYTLLWSICYTRLVQPDGKVSQDPEVRVETVYGPCYDRYKVYLYIIGNKCVGLCLVERISKAYQVVATEEPDTMRTIVDRGQELGNVVDDMDAPVTVAETADDAWMGISRIWVSSGFRNKGVATALLDQASRTFREKMTTPKHLIAFSQPTQSGARLARRWFGRAYGWHVYKDCNVTMEVESGQWYSRREDEPIAA